MSGSFGSNSATDPNIALQAGRGTQQQTNPLQQIEQFAVTKNLLNSNLLFPGQLQQQQQATQNNQISLQQHINSAAYGALAPLLAGGPITHDSLTSALGSIEGNLGLPTNGIIADVLATSPGGDGPAFDAKIRSLIASRMQTSPESALAAVTQRAGPSFNNGYGTQQTVVTPPGSPTPGVTVPVGQASPNYLTPQERSQQNTRPANADDAARLGVAIGTPITEPLQTRLQQQGAGGLVAPPGVVVGTGGPVSPQSAPRLNQAPPSPGAAPSPGAVQPPRAPGAVATGMAPTAPAEMAASTEQYNAASAAANTYQQRVFPLQQAAAALRNTNTGPGTETVNQIKSFLLAQSPASLQKYLPGVDPEKIANYDEAVKYLASYAMNQPGAANSDMHLGLAQTANASTHISNTAAQRVVENALGLERMQQAAVTQFNEQHTDPNTGSVTPGSGAQFNQFMQKFSATHDPRGFSWDDQDAAQQQAALKSMTAADKRRLLESVTLARKYQLTGTPGG
jgi:hypothetical protein